MNINEIRRKITHQLTSGLGRSVSTHNDVLDPQKVRNILISRPNHRLGNTLLITPLIQEVHKVFPEAKIDIFLKGGVGHVVFQEYAYVDKLITLPKKHFKELGKYLASWFRLRKTNYDLAINVEQGSSSGRISLQMANSKFKFFGDDQDLKKDSEHIAKYPVLNFRSYIASLGIKSETAEIPTLNLMLTNQEKQLGKTQLQDLTKSEKPTICLFTYATGAKCFSQDWWTTFYNHLQKKYPQFNFIEILPIENVSQIGFQAPSFYSSDIRLMTAVMHNCIAFIGADSGIMHLASAAQIPVIGLFKSRAEKYGPYGNSSDAIIVADDNMQVCLEKVDRILETVISK